MLEGEVRQHHVERVIRERSTRATQVDQHELIEVGERWVRSVQVDADEASDTRAESDQGRLAPASSVEDGDGPR